MQNSVTFTAHIKQEYDIEITHPNGFQYAVIYKPYRSSYDPGTFYAPPIITPTGKDVVVALFSHREYAEIFMANLHRDNDFYIKTINKGLYTE